MTASVEQKEVCADQKEDPRHIGEALLLACSLAVPSEREVGAADGGMPAAATASCVRCTHSDAAAATAATSSTAIATAPPKREGEPWHTKAPCPVRRPAHPVPCAAHVRSQLDMLARTIDNLMLTQQVLLQQLEEAKRLASDRRSDSEKSHEGSVDGCAESGRRKHRMAESGSSAITCDNDDDDDIYDDMPSSQVRRMGCDHDGSSDSDADEPRYRSVAPIAILGSGSGPKDEFDDSAVVDDEQPGAEGIVWRSACCSAAEITQLEEEALADKATAARCSLPPRRAPLDVEALRQCRSRLSELDVATSSQANTEALQRELSRLVAMLRT